MSPVASIFVVDAADLPAIAAAGPGGAIKALRSRGQELEDEYFWSGDNLLMIIQSLWRIRKISLFSVTHQRVERALDGGEASAVIIVGPEHKPLLPKLDPSTYDGADLVKALVAWGVSRTEALASVRDALAMLHQRVGELEEGQALAIHVG
jgi:hypothetical protein